MTTSRPGGDGVDVWLVDDPDSASQVLRTIVGSALGRPADAVVIDREPCRRCGGPHGRPVVRDGDGLHVSLSRTSGLALVALRRGLPVGVDVERRRPVPELAAVALSRDETGDDPLRSWVHKEALVKSTGDGLTRDPASFSLHPGPGPGTRTAAGFAETTVELRLGHPDGADVVAVVAGIGLTADAVVVHLPSTVTS
ncbi:4'-phosphopantetheinyl transferase family protein [Frigoribacterium sp. 2-23]|uniref:4'-phosphopantetheinyl transferase family protein n=1 Tax=Frigoribacterium sp. 2-23 TaxID=3415006 RepID=UPI003C6EA7DE